MVVPLFFCPEFLPGFPPGRNYNRSGKARTCSRRIIIMKGKQKQEGENDEYTQTKQAAKQAVHLSAGGRFEAEKTRVPSPNAERRGGEKQKGGVFGIPEHHPRWSM